MCPKSVNCVRFIITIVPDAYPMDLQFIISFLIMINPFALFLYLRGVMEDLSDRDFVRVLAQASLISFVIYLTFAMFGEYIFVHVFKINYESFRIFGGLVIFYLAFTFTVIGGRSMISLKETLDDTASEIALPFMVGAGSISLSILLGHLQPPLFTAIHLFVILLLNFMIILGLKWVKSLISRRLNRVVFDKYMSILVRLMGFLIGGVGIDMIFQGIATLFSLPQPK